MIFRLADNPLWFIGTSAVRDELFFSVVPAISIIQSIAENGNFTAVTVSVQPTNTPASLTGQQVGNFVGKVITATPTVQPATITGQQQGSFSSKVVSVQPTNSPTNLTGQQQGSFNTPSTSAQSIVTTPTLTTAEPVNNLPFRFVVQSDKITFNVNNDKIYFKI